MLVMAVLNPLFIYRSIRSIRSIRSTSLSEL